MTMIDPARDELSALRDLCGGAIAFPGDDGYDAARGAFNLAVDQRPAAVAYPADAAEVAEVVRAARACGLRVAPQSTGHNAGPLGSLADTVLLKTSGMGGVEIDAERRIARVGAGVVWEDVVDAAAPHGLIALHGSSPNVGVAGYSLGGGMGWLARSHGLQTNSVTAIELVTAEGELVRTDADNDPELFWALRGGGGNFGVVTALEFRLYPLTEIYAGFMMWDWTEAERVLVEIDAERRIARVGAGVVWEDVVDAAAPHGLVALHGSSPERRRRRLLARRRHGLARPQPRPADQQRDRDRARHGRRRAGPHRRATTTRSCSGRCAAAAATSASSPRSSSASTR